MENKFMAADILLPKDNFEKWSVVACDQYTSDSEYWKETEKNADGSPSALNLVLPEIYLEENVDKRIESINQNMQKYLDNNVFKEYKNSMIYLERETSGRVRKGIVGLIDLKDYDYVKGSTALIRATEETVLERIPPRVKIRKDASLELPHVMLLVDDPDFKIIEPIAKKKDKLEKVYDFTLMQNGGHIEGYLLKDECEEIGRKLIENLPKTENPLMFAVGDGNHSLATAKECSKLSNSPLAQYALVEVVNIHDPSLEFEPIYRVLFNLDIEKFMKEFRENFKESTDENAQKFTVITAKQEEIIAVSPTAKLPVGTLQPFLDKYLKDNQETKIDYIHGEEEVYRLSKMPNTLGFIFKGMEKSDLFPAIMSDGSLPRKTFSMGHAYDKRYYLETRKIK